MKHRLEILADLSAAFAELGFDLEVLLRSISSRVSAALRCTCEVHLDGAPLDAGLAGGAIRASAPIAAGGQVIGAIHVERSGGEPFTDEDLLLLADIGHRAALAILRVREHDALRDEQRRLDAVLQQMPSAVAIVEAPSGKPLLSNRQNFAIFRLGSQSVEDRTQYGRYRGVRSDGSELSPEEWPLSRSITHGEVVTGEEIEIIRGDGTHGWIRINSAPVRDEHGAIVAGVVTYDDVTEQRRTRERYQLLAKMSETLASSREWEQTLAHVIELALPALGDFGFFDVIEADGSVRRLARAPGDPARQAILDRTRWVRSDRTDKNLCALSTGAAGLHEAIDDAWLEDVATSPEHLATMKRLGFVSMMTVPIRYEARLLGALTLFATDRVRAHGPDDLAFAQSVANRAAAAVENARLYRELGAALTAAREADRRKDEFLAMLGHELRNPLAPILTALELMRLRAPHALEKERRVIERQSRHLVRLVDDLLDVSRIARGKVVIERQPTRASEVIARAVETVSPLLEERKHRLEIDVPHEIILSGDQQRLEQVFANLLTNAARYTDPGGRIEVRAEERGLEASLEVIDNGQGISPQLLPRIFDLFVQGERGPDRADGGLGLGLAIVKSLIDLHGGSVAVDSPGKGTRFTVRLPVARPDEAAAMGPNAPSGTQAGPAAERSERRVLIVDDNRDAAETLKDALSDVGFTVAIAHDPAAALQAAASFDPHVAVLDIGLPVMDGYELGKRLNASKPVALVALTGYGQKADRERSEHAGFAAHLVKPVNLDRLLEVVDRLTAQ